jgi:hypothetical protein
MEIAMKGSGEIVVRFIDRRGKTLMQESIRISGSETIEAKREISLFVETFSGQVLVSPVLVRQGEKQQVTFDGEPHASFTKKRCHEIGCTQSVTEDAVRSYARGLQEDTIRLPSAQTPNDK